MIYVICVNIIIMHYVYFVQNAPNPLAFEIEMMIAKSVDSSDAPRYILLLLYNMSYMHLL